MTNHSPTSTSGEPPHLERQLSNRHIQLIAIGGAIGTGLFMGSGKTISAAGPSVISGRATSSWWSAPISSSACEYG